MPATKGAQREELGEVDVDWLIAERPGKVRTLKQHPRKNKTAINIEYMKASIRARWSTHFASSSDSSAS
jgi:IS5 family transposase